MLVSHLDDPCGHHLRNVAAAAQPRACIRYLHKTGRTTEAATLLSVKTATNGTCRLGLLHATRSPKSASVAYSNRGKVSMVVTGATISASAIGEDFQEAAP
jgi:hypothetical protein